MLLAVLTVQATCLRFITVPRIPRVILRATEDADARAGPRHVAVIPDGNSRWATAQGLPRRDGHWAGVESLRTVVDACAANNNIDVLTVYAFSFENWQRPQLETQWIFELVERVLIAEYSRLLSLGVRCASRHSSLSHTAL